MSGKTLSVFILLTVIAVAISYIFYFNPQPVVVHYKADGTMEYPLALILISSFAAGGLLMLAITCLVAIRLKFINRQVVKQKDAMSSHRDLIAQGRGFLALGNTSKARDIFKKIIKKDDKDVVARLMLAKTYERAGEAKEALAVLDKARREKVYNVELLLEASDMNAEMGNNTAAYDNAAAGT